MFILLGGEDEDLEDLEDDELSSSIMDAFQYKVDKHFKFIFLIVAPLLKGLSSDRPLPSPTPFFYEINWKFVQ